MISNCRQYSGAKLQSFTALSLNGVTCPELAQLRMECENMLYTTDDSQIRELHAAMAAILDGPSDAEFSFVDTTVRFASTGIVTKTVTESVFPSLAED